jgi:hypothetical protein
VRIEQQQHRGDDEAPAGTDQCAEHADGEPQQAQQEGCRQGEQEPEYFPRIERRARLPRRDGASEA